MKKKYPISSKVRKLAFFGILISIIITVIYRLLKATPLIKIQGMFNVFERMRGGSRCFERSGIPISSEIVGQFEHFYSVFIYEEDAENPYSMTLIGSSSGTFHPDIIPDDAAREKHEALKNHLQNGIPLGLQDFPLAIKIDENNLKALRDRTAQKDFLLFPCIEDGWEDENGNQIPDVPATRQIHLTVGILGSEEKDSYVINSVHYRGIDGEETWPYEDFVWFYE